MENKELAIEFASYCLDRDKNDLEQLFLDFSAQKEVKKDYEILSFFNKDNKLIYQKHGDNTFNFNGINGYSDVGERNYNYCIKYYQINSVKRLSDGEVFTVNEVVSLKNGWNKGKIDGIKLTENNEIYLHSREGGFGQVLKNIFKVKQPLFTTQDGFEIYGGETLWAVSDSLQLLKTDFAQEKDKTVRSFIKRENAENYISDNKSRFSLNDVEQLLSELTPHKGWYSSKLERFIKQHNNG